MPRFLRSRFVFGLNVLCFKCGGADASFSTGLASKCSTVQPVPSCQHSRQCCLNIYPLIVFKAMN